MANPKPEKRPFAPPALSLAVWMLAALAGGALAADGDQAACARDNMPAAALKSCARRIAAPELTAHERSQIFAERASDWLKEDEPVAAVADFTRAIAADKSNLAAITGRARAYALIGEHAKAADDWSLLIALTGEKSDAFEERGKSKLAAGDTTAALADFTHAVELNPNNTEAFVGRAMVYEKLNDRQSALREFNSAIATGPELWTTYLARAEVADRWGDKQMAIDNYRLVIKYNRQYWNAYKALHRLGVDHYFGQKP